MKRHKSRKNGSLAVLSEPKNRIKSWDISSICGEFEKAKKASKSVSIDDFVNAAPQSAQLSLLMALLGIEAEYEAASSNGIDDQPSVLSRYTIQGDLGSGGMGRVYLAYDHQLGAEVALKFLIQDVTLSKDAKRRFLREARLMEEIDHPNVMPLLEVGERSGCPYIAMPVCNQTLADRLESGSSLTGAEIVRIGKELAAGLDEIHKKGFTHRDIKPANIGLMNYDEATGNWERTVLMDFGLAVTDQDSKSIADVSLTRTGMLLGTVPYMAPEQAESPENADARSDLFSLGCTLYECACGHRPFTGPSQVSILIRLGKDRPVSPSVENPSIPRCLSVFILRLLEKNPNQRPSNAKVVVEELSRLESLIQPTENISDCVNKVVWHTDQMARSTCRAIRYTPRKYQCLGLGGITMGIALLAVVINFLLEIYAPTVVGIKQWVGYTPLAVAKEMDLFPGSTGVDFSDVSLVEDMYVDLGNGTIDIAMVLIDNLVREGGSYAKRADSPDRPTTILKIDTSRGSDGIVASSEIRSVKDFNENRKFLYQHDDVSHFLFNILCKNEGVDFRDIMKFGIEADPDSAAKGFLKASLGSDLKKSNIVAAGTYDPHLTNLLRHEGINTRLLIDSDSDNIARDKVVDIMVCRQSFLEDSNQRVQNLLTGWFEAVEILTNEKHPRHQEALNLAYKFNGAPADGSKWNAKTWTENDPCSKEDYKAYMVGLTGRDREVIESPWPDRQENVEFFKSELGVPSKFHQVFDFCKEFYKERNLNNLNAADFDGSAKVFPVENLAKYSDPDEAVDKQLMAKKTN